MIKLADRIRYPTKYANTLLIVCTICDVSVLQYALQLNPEDWGASALHVSTPEPDDYLHTPDPKRDLKSDKGGHIFTVRGIANLGCLFLLVVLMLMLL